MQEGGSRHRGPGDLHAPRDGIHSYIMPYKKIDEYGVIGNGTTVALCGRDGSIDWLCLPYLDSPSVFAAILDDRRGGRFAIRPVDEHDSVQRYLPRTNILEILFRTGNGEVELLDFMPEPGSSDPAGKGDCRVLRRVRGLAGSVPLHIECSPRFDYARIEPDVDDPKANHRIWKSGDHVFSLAATKAFRWENEVTTVHLDEGETLWLCAGNDEEHRPAENDTYEGILQHTKAYWENWVQSRELGKYPGRGFWQKPLDRSALALKLLQMRHTGAIAAASTMGLPTIIHGERNWDYRFTWIRDSSFTLGALFELGHADEFSKFVEWLKKITEKEGGVELKALYRLREPVPPDGESTMDHLRGYKGSKPVIYGQHNIGQDQHDIYGELLSMFDSVSRFVGKIDFDDWPLIRQLVDHVIDIWREPDHGIWELRTGPHHLVHSKLMCWVAIDRGIRIADHYGFPSDLGRWREERDAVREDILANGYSEKLGRFKQHYDNEAIDASLLLIPLMDFLPATDERVLRTIEAVERELMPNGVVLRYREDDGLPGQEHGFLFCHFWYLRCLIRQGRLDEVDEGLRTAEEYSNHLGLMGEQYDYRYQEITGNFPQAFSHIGYASTILEYLDARSPRIEPNPASFTKKLHLLIRPPMLTPARDHDTGEAIENPGQHVRRILFTLRGHFYDSHAQRVDYWRIPESDYYQDFLEAVAGLRHFDPAQLTSDTARIAFWTNVYNTIVIHGVIALGIRSSIKEVPWFFDRIRYAVGDYVFSAADIEHGILRNNARPPRWPFRQFRHGDSRTSLCIEDVDPRVHFALVCASRACAPIEAYDAAELDGQLDESARVFINSTSRLERKEGKLGVSKVFQWYKSDFQNVETNLPMYLSNYWYDEEEARWMAEHAEELAIEFLPYDWRLNR